MTSLDRDRSDCPDDVGCDNFKDALSRFLPIQTERPGQLLTNSPDGGIAIDRKFSAKHRSRAEPAEGHVRIGHGWPRSAALVADWTGVCAGADRAHSKEARWVNMSD